jgi:hypothetical protein
MYKNGLGVTQNDAEAAHWCDLSTEKGYICSQYIFFIDEDSYIRFEPNNNKRKLG